MLSDAVGKMGMNKKIILIVLFVCAFTVSLVRADETSVSDKNVTIDLSDSGVTENAQIAGSGSTADLGDVSESEVEQAELLEVEDGEILESLDNYAMYDFSQYVPVKYDPGSDKEAKITNRQNRMTLAKTDFTVHTRSEVKGQDEKLSLYEYNVSVKAPILYKGQNKLLFNIDYSYFGFDTDMRLNNLDHNKYGYGPLGSTLPDMQSLAFMVNYRYEFKDTKIFNGLLNDTTIGADVIVDSRSDKLFNSLDETNLTTMISFRLPIFENQAITVMAGYFSDFKLPVAGVTYQLNFGKASYLNIGFPLNNVHINSADLFHIDNDRFNFDFNWIVFGDLSTRLSYDIIRGKLQVFGNFEWNTEAWARANREDKRSRVFYTDCHLGGGVRVDFLKYLYVQAESGWAFARNIYEERNYFDYSSGYDIEDSAYFKVEAGIVF